MEGVFVEKVDLGEIVHLLYSNKELLKSPLVIICHGWNNDKYEGSNLAELYVDDEEKKEKGQIYSHSVYPVVKGGVISLTRYLAAYWGGKNIRVNCISPGGVYHEGENETFVKKYSAKVPLGRKAEVREISGTVVDLASDESSYVTGQNIIVDDGWSL